MGMHPNDQAGPKLSAKAQRDADYAKLAQSRNRLSTQRLPKSDKEVLLREIHRLEDLYGIPSRKYNGGGYAI